ncbi:helix-turn-helix transcriptional regulator [Streptomyces sp. ML-6]|uniref:helix-turn-helix transcriptional regulator n=1 Tax=Streptomyces sp. ML-6 TaxID=2982693 RepID=UPI0024C06487|nr:helix-turn-helix transcriptional regulator [Streptomyces sp. ML-6]MDK0520404.1 helix-turn-helix domain-containing protein [Streptomyces sp. ML-6]
MRPHPPSDRAAYRRHVGEQIRAHRLAANLTQQALAESAGLEKQTVSLIENGHQSPRIDTVWRIARALGVSVADLVRE